MYKVIGVDQRIYGPVSAEQIRRWLAEGRLNAGSLLQIEGAPDWRPLAAFPEFAAPPPIYSTPAVPANDGTGALALTSLILGVASNVCCCFGLLLALIGLIFSIVALLKMEGRPDHPARWVAWAGFVFSVIGLISSFLIPITSLIGHGLLYRRSWRWL